MVLSFLITLPTFVFSMIKNTGGLKDIPRKLHLVNNAQDHEDRQLGSFLPALKFLWHLTR